MIWGNNHYCLFDAGSHRAYPAGNIPLPGITIAGVGGFLFAASGVIYAYTVGETAGHITLFLSLTAFAASFVWLLRARSFNKVALKTDVDSKLTSSRDLGIEPGDEGHHPFTPCPHRQSTHQGHHCRGEVDG